MKTVTLYSIDFHCYNRIPDYSYFIKYFDMEDDNLKYVTTNNNIHNMSYNKYVDTGKLYRRCYYFSSEEMRNQWVENNPDFNNKFWSKKYIM